jgi:uncharacterized protein
MAGEIRYRTGIDARTGQILTGPQHLAQSLGIIWQTRIQTRLMRLPFGADLRSLLSEDLTPALALMIYNEMVASAARWEPEYELAQLQLVTLKDSGSLGIRHGGLYFPEGRFGNYDIAVSLALGATTPSSLGVEP